MQLLIDYATMSGTPTELADALQAASDKVDYQIENTISGTSYLPQLLLMRELIKKEKLLYNITNVVWVYQASDLPVPVSNVITLDNNTVYLIAGYIDLGAARLTAQTINILGLGYAKSIITSTTSGALITGSKAIQVKNIGFDAVSASYILSCNGDGTQSLELEGLLFANSGVPCGTIDAYIRQSIRNCRFSGCGGFTFKGTTSQSVIFENNVVESLGTSVTLLLFQSASPAFSVSGRLAIRDNVFNAGSGTTCINIQATSSIVNADSFVVENNTFSGVGTYITGIDQTSDKAYFRGNVNYRDSVCTGHWYMQGNATATVIAATNTYVKVAGTTTSGTLERFTMPADNRLTYTGTQPRRFSVSVVLSCTSGNANDLGFAIFKSTGGGAATLITGAETKQTTSTTIATLIPLAFGIARTENSAVNFIVDLITNDYLELHCKNNTATNNITVSSAIFTIEEL